MVVNTYPLQLSITLAFVFKIQIYVFQMTLFLWYGTIMLNANFHSTNGWWRKWWELCMVLSILRTVSFKLIYFAIQHMYNIYFIIKIWSSTCEKYFLSSYLFLLLFIFSSKSFFPQHSWHESLYGSDNLNYMRKQYCRRLLLACFSDQAPKVCSIYKRKGGKYIVKGRLDSKIYIEQ